jgi:hypothetical protein
MGYSLGIALHLALRIVPCQHAQCLRLTFADPMDEKGRKNLLNSVLPTHAVPVTRRPRPDKNEK